MLANKISLMNNLILNSIFFGRNQRSRKLEVAIRTEVGKEEGSSVHPGEGGLRGFRHTILDFDPH